MHKWKYRHCERWTLEEEKALIGMRLAGVSWPTIAFAMGRSIHACESHLFNIKHLFSLTLQENIKHNVGLFEKRRKLFGRTDR